MIIQLGNFLFHHRNVLFPVVYALLILKSPPVLADYRLAALLGVAVALTGQVLRAMTIGWEYIIRGGRNRKIHATKLVQGGMFAHCRNPLYVGNFLILVGVGIAANSVVFLSCAIPFFAVAYWSIIAAEENYLRNEFGREFEAYCSRVKRLVPDFSGFQASLRGMRFNWARLVTAEYGSTFLWVAATILVTLRNVYLNGEYKTSSSVPVLYAFLGMATAGYVVARVLKKCRVLEPG